jgi:lipoyl(octanoyl) transferase
MMNVRYLGLCNYTDTYQAMQEFTAQCDIQRPDAIWVCEHPPVYTLGRHSNPMHLPTKNTLPIVQTDRGGQITYHGPGQLIVYFLLNLRRRKQGIKNLVHQIEQSTQDLLADYGIVATLRPDAPGVYVSDKKIASIGLRVKRGRTYHGMSLNLNMDLTPFQYINPCGYVGLEMTQLRDFIIWPETWSQPEDNFTQHAVLAIGKAFVAHFSNL